MNFDQHILNLLIVILMFMITLVGNLIISLEISIKMIVIEIFVSFGSPLQFYKQSSFQKIQLFKHDDHFNNSRLLQHQFDKTP